MSFETAVAKTLEAEGVFSNDAGDPGGETKYGISKRAYPTINIAALTVEQAKAIYKRDYWDLLRLDEVQSRWVGEELFDTAVNCGTGTAQSIAYRACNLLSKAHNDLALGAAWSEVIRRLNEHSIRYELQLVIALNLYQGKYYIELAERKPDLGDRFIRGWMRRLVLPKALMT